MAGAGGLAGGFPPSFEDVSRSDHSASPVVIDCVADLYTAAAKSAPRKIGETTANRRLSGRAPASMAAGFFTRTTISDWLRREAAGRF